VTTEDHLSAIVAECRRLLALSAKRTPGQWKSKLNHKPYKVVWINRDESYSTADLSPEDADYIAACAGRAEAGWRATIAAIEGLIDMRSALPLNAGPGCNAMLSEIIAAWPMETLK
jgi:hypothetical protein